MCFVNLSFTKVDQIFGVIGMSKLIASAMLMLVIGSPAVAESTFNGSQTVGTFSATYTIVTDGVTGPLDSSNIISWSVTLNNGSLTPSFSNSDGGALYLVNSQLSSDGVNLLWDYGLGDSNTDGYAYFVNGADPRSFLCFQLNGCVDASRGSVWIADPWPIEVQTTSQRGQQIIASISGAVPEPATWAMMLLGFGGIGFAMRRRRFELARPASPPPIARTRR